MKRQVFYSFHYEKDSRRAAQIRNIGVIEGNNPVSDNDWETIKHGGEKAIKRWIDYEIIEAWNKGMGIFGIYIHNIKDPLLGKLGYSGKSNMGYNPFDNIKFKNGQPLSSVVPCYNPRAYDAYNDIAANIEQWVEKSIKARG